MKRRRRNNQRKIIIIISVCLLFIMSVGYAAFQTNLTITAKGNLKGKINAAEQLIEKATSGDGLYEDTYQVPENEKRYVYKGSNPNNYIKFNDEIWRIVSIETDETLKIIHPNKITDRVFENSNVRSAQYCNKAEYGCNVWGSNTTMLDASGSNITAMPIELGGFAFTLPEEESQLAQYLNNEYYAQLKEEAKSLIDNHLWNAGPASLAQTQETDYKWRGNIGLINLRDYQKASTNISCMTTNSRCENNYLTTDYHYWTITPAGGIYSVGVWIICDTYMNGPVNIERSVRPAVYLKSDITLSGSGTETNPYIIK